MMKMCWMIMTWNHKYQNRPTTAEVFMSGKHAKGVYWSCHNKSGGISSIWHEV